MKSLFLVMALFLALSAEAVTVSASFTATGTGASLTLKNKDIATYSVSGTFVGTVKLERSLNGGATWEEISSVTGSATGTLTAEHPSGQNTNYRFRCSAYTSGTIVTSLVDADSVVQTFTDKHGSPVFTITDGGVSIPGTLSVTGATSLTGAVTSSGLVEYTAGSDIASGTTVNLETATGNIVDVTGTTTITGITLSAGHMRIVRFTGALTLTHGASLVLPGAANITTAAGDYAIFVGYASDIVRCVDYVPAAWFMRLDGTQTVAGAKTFSGITTVSNATASTSTSTGGLVVTGGLGVGGAINGGSTLTTSNQAAFGNSSVSGDMYIRFGYGNAVSGSAATQYGMYGDAKVSTSGTTAFHSFYSAPKLAASTNTATVSKFAAGAINYNSTGTATRTIAFYSNTAETGGSAGNACLADNNSFSGNYFINQSGTEASSFAGVASFTAGLKTKVSTADTSNPPTNAELVSAFGAAATTGAGFTALVDDNNGHTAEYLIWSDGTKYWYATGTAAP